MPQDLIALLSYSAMAGGIFFPRPVDTDQRQDVVSRSIVSVAGRNSTGDQSCCPFLTSGEDMKDIKKRIDELRADADDCMLIGDLAINDEKEESFRTRAQRLRALAADLEKLAADKDLSRRHCSS